jgi:hypothetical protein
MHTRRKILKTIGAAAASSILTSREENDDPENLDDVERQLEAQDESQPGKENFSDDWPTVENDLQNTGISDTTGMPIENIEQKRKTEKGFKYNPIVVADTNNIYAEDDQAVKFKAFDRQNGDKKWEEQMVGGLGYAPAAAHGKLYGTDLNGNFKAIDTDTGDVVHQSSVDAISDVVSLADGNIATFGAGKGPVEVFDEQLNSQAKFKRNTNAGINTKTATVNSNDKFVYAESGTGDQPFLRMLDFDGSEIQEIRSSGLPNDGARIGAVLVEDVPNVGDVYVYNNRDETVGRRADKSSNFGSEIFSFDALSDPLDETSPVPYKTSGEGFVFGGTTEGEFYGVNINNGNGMVFEEEGFFTNELVSDGEYLAVGFAGVDIQDAAGIKIYDLDDLASALTGSGESEVQPHEEGESQVNVQPVAEIDDIDYPHMLADGELWGADGNFNEKNPIRVFAEGSGGSPDVSFSIEKPTGVAGDTFNVEPSADNPGMADKFAFTVTDQDGNIFYDTNTQSLPTEWDLLSDPDDSIDDAGKYDLILQAINDGNVVDDHSATSSLEGLDAGIEGSNSAKVGDEETYSLIGDPDKLPAIDENTWELLKNGDIVESGKGDSFTVKFGDEGEYQVAMDSDVDTRVYSSDLSVNLTEEDPALKHRIGDVDMDGEIDIVDAVRIQRYLAELDPNPFDQELADVRRSGDVDITDAVLIQQYLAEIRGPRHVSADDLSTDQGSLYADVKNTGGMGARDNAQLTITPQTDEANRIIQGYEPGDPVDLEDLLYSSTVKTEIFDTAPEGGTDLLEYDISDLSDGTYTAVLNTGDDTGKITFTV